MTGDAELITYVRHMTDQQLAAELRAPKCRATAYAVAEAARRLEDRA